MTEYRFFPFPRVYSTMKDMCDKEIYKWTGANNVRLVSQGDRRFCFEDIDYPENSRISKFIGLVDPLSDIDIDTDCNHVVYFVDDDDSLGKMIVIATDGGTGFGVELFHRVVKYYGM